MMQITKGGSDMDIGGKLKAARLAAGMTQEQIAEALGVSRQTVSNWENGRTYPDIVSVVKLSDIYEISLDTLLKEEKAMTKYTEYLAESTDVVRSKNRLTKALELGIYTALWTFCILLYRLHFANPDVPSPNSVDPFSMLVLLIVLPVLTMLLGLVAGMDSGWSRRGRVLLSVFCGVMCALMQLGVFTVDTRSAGSFLADAAKTTCSLEGLLLFAAGTAIAALFQMLGLLLRRTVKQK